MTTEVSQKPLWRRLILPLGGGALAGFIGASAFFTLVEIDGEGGLGASREIAGLIGVIYVLTGLMVLVGALNPAVGAKFLNVEDADELREQRNMLWLSGVAMALLGAALIVLAIAGAGEFIPARVGAIAAVALIAVASVLSVRSRRYTDELQRALSSDATTTAFYLLFFIGGGWAMFAHLDMVADPAPLDWLSLFAGALLVAAFWQTGKRGLLMRGPN